ncbi:cupin domain-containing protein [Propylenella binzhouense]|uniref:cupin domain-containing protein n=1 Tax=Propylenella binzhouense TaxID=2555902 RepID=UPI00196815EB
MVQAPGTRRAAELATEQPADLPDSRRRAEQPEYHIGSKLKHARLVRGHTLKELAEIVGCSESMLSKLENEKLTPSISFLHRLASALGTSIAELFAEGDQAASPVHHFPAERRARIVEDPELGRSGAWFERIIPIAKSGLLQANILNIPPGVRSDGMVQHVGEELGYLIEGELDVVVDDKAYTMRSGDLLFFPSSLPHGYENRGERVARILWVNTPPSL